MYNSFTGYGINTHSSSEDVTSSNYLSKVNSYQKKGPKVRSLITQPSIPDIKQTNQQRHCRGQVSMLMFSRLHSVSHYRQFKQSSNLSPGTYNVRERVSIPGGVIPVSPRFFKNSHEVIRQCIPHKRNWPDLDKSVFRNIEKRNRDLQQYTPNSRAQSRKAKAKCSEIKMQSAKQTKKDIDMATKTKRVNIFKEKAEKYQLRMKRRG